MFLIIIQPSNFKLSSLREDIGCPYHFTAYYSRDYVKFAKDENDCLVISFIIRKDLTTSLNVMGKKVASHPILQEMKSKILCLADVTETLKWLNNFDVCHGNLKTDFEDISETSLVNSVYFFMTQAYHSKNCELLIAKNSRIKRCQNCQSYRKSLQNTRWKKRRSTGTPSTVTKPSFLSKKELVAHVNRANRREKYHIKRIKYLNSKM